MALAQLAEGMLPGTQVRRKRLARSSEVSKTSEDYTRKSDPDQEIRCSAMMGQPLDSIPIPVVYLLTVLVLLAAMEGGFRLTKLLQRKRSAESDPGVGALVGATLALLAFLLAFVVGFAGTIFNERRQLVVDEANAIGTTYLRAGYLDEPYASDSRTLLREYVGMRVDAIDLEKRASAIDRSEQIHNELWTRAEEIARENPFDTVALYIESLNEMIDLHSERVAVGIGIRVPPTVLLGLYLVAIGTMFLVGINSGYHERRNIIALIVLVLILSVVFLLIVDLDRSTEGLLRVPQQPLFDLQRQLNH